MIKGSLEVKSGLTGASLINDTWDDVVGVDFEAIAWAR
jgi:hypothetical protein